MQDFGSMTFHGEWSYAARHHWNTNQAINKTSLSGSRMVSAITQDLHDRDFITRYFTASLLVSTQWKSNFTCASLALLHSHSRAVSIGSMYTWSHDYQYSDIQAIFIQHHASCSIPIPLIPKNMHLMWRKCFHVHKHTQIGH